MTASCSRSVFQSRPLSGLFACAAGGPARTAPEGRVPLDSLSPLRRGSVRHDRETAGFSGRAHYSDCAFNLLWGINGFSIHAGEFREEFLPDAEAHLGHSGMGHVADPGVAHHLRAVATVAAQVMPAPADLPALVPACREGRVEMVAPCQTRMLLPVSFSSAGSAGSGTFCILQTWFSISICPGVAVGWTTRNPCLSAALCHSELPA